MVKIGVYFMYWVLSPLEGKAYVCECGDCLNHAGPLCMVDEKCLAVLVGRIPFNDVEFGIRHS